MEHFGTFLRSIFRTLLCPICHNSMRQTGTTEYKSTNSSKARTRSLSLLLLIGAARLTFVSSMQPWYNWMKINYKDFVFPPSCSSTTTPLVVKSTNSSRLRTCDLLCRWRSTRRKHCQSQVSSIKCTDNIEKCNQWKWTNLLNNRLHTELIKTCTKPSVKDS